MSAVISIHDFCARQTTHSPQAIISINIQQFANYNTQSQQPTNPQCAKREPNSHAGNAAVEAARRAEKEAKHV